MFVVLGGDRWRGDWGSCTLIDLYERDVIIGYMIMNSSNIKTKFRKQIIGPYDIFKSTVCFIFVRLPFWTW